MDIRSSLTFTKPLVSALNDCEKPLADLFIVFGLSKNSFKGRDISKATDLPPQILDSYPQTVRQEELHSMNLLYLCFPEGYKLIEVKPSKDPIKSQHSLNHITITNDVGEKKYATSLLFYVSVKVIETILGNNDTPKTLWLVPMSFCIISQLPLFDLQKKWLIEAYESYIAAKSESSMKVRSKTPPAKKYTLEFYISLLFHHIYYNSEWQNEVEIYYRDHHKHRKTFARYRNYKPVGFTLPNFTFQPLLESIKPNRILDLIKFLLLEKKILLVRDHYSDNAVIIESLLMLLSPL